MNQLTGRELLTQLDQMTKKVVAVRVGDQLFDLHTPLPEGTTTTTEGVRAVHAHEKPALAVIRHSTAHVMADAVQRLFPGTKVAFGPAIDAGFYYDYQLPGGGTFSDEDLARIEEKMLELIEADSPFRREVIEKDDARKLLGDMGETFKSEHLERLEGEITLYRHGQPDGEWVDLCEGPHVPSTGFLKAFKLTHVAGAYWRGDERNPMLQRIYGTAFANPKLLRKHLKQLEEAKKRDHRKLGKELELIAFHPLAPASPFFQPRGTKIYNMLVEYIRDLYQVHGYQEVITPQVFDTELFVTSGHLPGYAEAMYLGATIENLEKAGKALIKKPPADAKEAEQILRDTIRYGVKPMNCPSHCLMYGMKRRSYRELPFRIADFGRLHRFERSGVVQGMTRVRTFAQDDAHIFCMLEQVQSEIQKFLKLVYAVYEDFAFEDVNVIIATRPDKRIGSDEIWDTAEQALILGVEAQGLRYEIAEGEGAFYGPKIELHLKDAIGRSWQMGTMQADFTLPERFDLKYVAADNSTHRPVMLHRAMLGSVERFFGVLIEHVGGNFPTWIAPEQITLVTVASDYDDYAREAAKELEARGLRVELDLANERLGGKIRAARLRRVPYIGVVGEKEQTGRGLSVRSRDENKDLGFIALSEIADRLSREALPPSARS